MAPDDAARGPLLSPKTWTLIAAVLGSSIVFLDSAVLTVALPAIGREPRHFVEVLEAQNYIQYGYLLTLSSLLVLAGALSDYYGRDMTLARAAPDDFTIDQYHPDVEGADGAGRRDAVADQKLGSAFFAELGMDSPVPVGAFFDLFPLSVITTSTLDRLQVLAPGSRFDPRRFRMNVIVASREAGFIENDWIGHALQIGDAVRLRVALRDPRCVMTTLAQGDLPKDTHVLRALVQHNKVQVGPADKLPCAGVYAVTETSGTIQVGDAVTLD